MCLTQSWNNPPLYLECRPAQNYQWSLDHFKKSKAQAPDIPTKSGLMIGYGEDKMKLLKSWKDLLTHNVEMLPLDNIYSRGKHSYPLLSATTSWWNLMEFRLSLPKSWLYSWAACWGPIGPSSTCGIKQSCRWKEVKIGARRFRKK